MQSMTKGWNGTTTHAAYVASRLPGPAERLELRERLSELDQLPERQRRLVWLRAFGLSYGEMAAYTGDSVRTVERQVLRASRSLKPCGGAVKPGQSEERPRA